MMNKIDRRFNVALSREDVENLCKEKEFFTLGSEEVKEAMLDMCHDNMLPDELLELAEVIIRYTDVPNNMWLAEYEPVDELVEYLLSLMTVKMTVTFVSRR